MNRHERRTLESIHQKFINGLQGDVKPYDPHEQEVITAFLNDVARYQAETGLKTYPTIYGVFGEWPGADGYVEKVVNGEDGEYYKLWGNSFLFKKLPDRHVIKTLDMAKWVLSDFPRETLMENRLIALATVFTAVFQKKHFIHLLDRIFDAILRRSQLELEKEAPYHRQAAELRRAAFKVIHDQYGLDDRPILDMKRPYEVRYREDQVGYLLLRIARFVGFFLEVDTAYLFRVQDAFGEAKTRGIEAFWEGLDTLMSREVAGRGVQMKWRFIKAVLRFGLWRYPEFERFLDALFNELDYGKLKMDENDRYFTLTYLSYNFGGRSKEDRFAERARIDRERNHVYLKK